MIWAAALLLFLASLFHGWYGGNYRAKSEDVRMAFILYHNYGLWIGIVLLLAGLVLLWIAQGFLCAIAGAIAYWFVLPLLASPLLVALKVIPRSTIPWLDRDA